MRGLGARRQPGASVHLHARAWAPSEQRGTGGCSTARELRMRALTSTENGRARTRARDLAAATGPGSTGGADDASPSMRTGQSASAAPAPLRDRCDTRQFRAQNALTLGCLASHCVLPRPRTRSRRHQEWSQAARGGGPLRRGADLKGVSAPAQPEASIAQESQTRRARAPSMRTRPMS